MIPKKEDEMMNKQIITIVLGLLVMSILAVPNVAAADPVPALSQ